MIYPSPTDLQILRLKMLSSKQVDLSDLQLQAQCFRGELHRTSRRTYLGSVQHYFAHYVEAWMSSLFEHQIQTERLEMNALI